MSSNPKKFTQKQQELLNQKSPSFFRNISGLTIAVGLVVLLAGLSIYRANVTQPIFTLLLLAISVPLVLYFSSQTLRKKIAKALAEVENDKPDKK
ncbi:MAG: exosortase/archaeosortase family protein [Anaerolineaceae bacterium]|nr:exosortase/archaeosortase family protein [Anaerolineaceae bacterium]